MHMHTHTHTHTLYRPIGVKDNVVQAKYSEKRNVLSWLLKEERVAECLMIIKSVKFETFQPFSHWHVKDLHQNT